MNRPLIAATRCESTYTLTEPNVLEGQIPADWYGHVFITSPAGNVNSGGLPYAADSPDQGSPIMNGDGYTFRIDLLAGAITITTKLMKPPCYYADVATRFNNPNGYGFLSAFGNWGISRMSADLGARNMLNTAITPVKFGQAENSPTRMLACYDAGRPWEIDINTLDQITAIGANSEYAFSTPPWLFPFPVIQTTAHPSFDPFTQELFVVNFTKSTSQLLDLEKTVEILKGDADKIITYLESVINQLSGFNNPEDQLKAIDLLMLNQADELKKHALNFLRAALLIRLGKPKTEAETTPIDNNVYLMRWMGKPGLLDKWIVLDETNEPIKIVQCIHQTTITEDYIILADAAFKFTLDLLFDNPFKISPIIETYIRCILTNPQEPFLDVYIINRSALDPSSPTVNCRKLAQPIPIEAIHFTADYKNPQKNITLHLAHNSAACLAEWVRDFDTLPPVGETAADPSEKWEKCFYDSLVTAGEKAVDPSVIGLMSAGCMDIGRIGKVIIDAEKATMISQCYLETPGNLDDIDYVGAHTWGVGLYTFRDIISADTRPDAIKYNYWSNYGLNPKLLTQFIYDLYDDYKNRLYTPEQMLNLTQKGIPFVLARQNVATMELEDYYQFSKEVILKSIQFVPRVSDAVKVTDDEQKDGYIFTTELVNYPNSLGDNYQCEIWIFKAWDLISGPCCKLHHPELDYAFTLHSAWTPDAVSQKAISYYIDPKKDYDPLISALEPAWRIDSIQELFDKFVYPNFKP